MAFDSILRFVPNADLAADDRVITDHHAAGEAGLRGYHDMIADLAVVSHVHHVVSFVPEPILVVPRAARSTHEFAPISTSSPMETPPIWGNFS